MSKPLITLEVNRQLSTMQAIALFQILLDVEAIQEVDVIHRALHLRDRFERTGALAPHGAGYVPVVVDRRALRKTLLVRTDDVPAWTEMLAPYGTAVQVVENELAIAEGMRQMVLEFADAETAWSVYQDWCDFRDDIMLGFIKHDLDVPRCRVCGCTDDDCSQCIEKTGDACSWVEDDLCSACVTKTGARYEAAFTILPDLNFLDVCHHLDNDEEQTATFQLDGDQLIIGSDDAVFLARMGYAWGQLEEQVLTGDITAAELAANRAECLSTR